MEKNAISKAALGRLPGYLQYLKGLPSEAQYVSATAIARALHLGEVQVRKDLSAVSGAGKPKVGYIIADLILQLEDTLGCHCLTPTVLVGAGKLGRALLDYNGFEEYGVTILAAFDRDERLLRAGEGNVKTILPVEELGAFCRSHGVQIGIITVGRESAQSVCDRMLESGITAIWNFAPCRLQVPEGVLVKQETLALSLAHLNNQRGTR
ncbi:MAG: redox-sensing transcriptional repressor Rex [Clostridia bacterium]|nr:redox-sensing transcriptional repressor Rex [Clostridia bacterium]